MGIYKEINQLYPQIHEKSGYTKQIFQYTPNFKDEIVENSWILGWKSEKIPDMPNIKTKKFKNWEERSKKLSLRPALSIKGRKKVVKSQIFYYRPKFFEKFLESGKEDI